MYDLTLPGAGAVQLQPGQRYWLAAPTLAESEVLLDICAGAAQTRFAGQVAVLESNGGLLSNLRVWENLVLPAWYQNIASLAQLEARFVAALNTLGLHDADIENVASALPATLERDRKRMLCVVRAAVLQPGLLLLDQDMFAYLSRSTLPGIKQLLGELSARAAVLVIGRGAPDAAWQLRDLTLNEADHAL